MLPSVERIDYARSGSAFEARLDELALIAGLRPGANRQGARPERAAYLRLADAAASAGSTSARRAWTRCWSGPVLRRRDGARAADALRLAYGLRSCRAAAPVEGACVEGRLGRCLAPCRGEAERAAHAEAVACRGGACCARAGRRRSPACASAVRP